MISKTLAVPAILALALAMAWGPAQAAARVINLTGSIADARTYVRNVGGVEQLQGEVLLDYNTSRPVRLVAGDTVEVNISFDQPFTIPASTSTTFFQVLLLSYVYPGLGTSTSDITTSFFKGGSQVAGAFAGGDTTTTGSLAAGTILPGVGNGAITFDRMVTTFDVAALGLTQGVRNFEVSAGLLFYNVAPVASAVPEPTHWALMLTGFAALGGALRARRSKSAVGVAA